MLDKR